jgi:tetratricopeptide (TPR) repeat protein
MADRAVPAVEETAGAESLDLAVALNLRAAGLLGLGDVERAREDFGRALVIREAVQGADHPETLILQNNVAALHLRAGDHEAAAELFTRVLRTREAQLGELHADTGVACNNLASAYREMGRHDEALALYERALAIYEIVHGAAHPNVATCLENIARIHTARGMPGAGIGVLRRALAIRLETAGADTPPTRNARLLLFQSLQATTGDLAAGEAARVHAEAADLLLEDPGCLENRPNTRVALVHGLVRAGRLEEAREQAAALVATGWLDGPESAERARLRELLGELGMSADAGEGGA